MEFLTANLPEILGTLGMLGTAVGGYLTAKMRAKHQLRLKESDAKTNFTIKEQEGIVKRQDQLAEQQMDFMTQMREDMRVLREELNEERKRSNGLAKELGDWRNNYMTLFEKYSELEKENRNLLKRMEDYESLKEQVKEYEKRIRELEEDLKKFKPREE